MESSLLRAQKLLEQRRYDLAERELRQVLEHQPNHAGAHAMLALCHSQARRHDEAIAESRQAFGLAPDDAYVHYIHSVVLHDAGQYRQSRQAVDQAIAINPTNADYFALLASLFVTGERWKDAAESARKGLALFAEHVDCKNILAIAQVHLGQRDEARTTIRGALGEDPDNPLTHANQGWAYLHENQPKMALEHFREALRLGPGNEWAKAGLVEGLKARNPIYRLLLAYFLWMSRLDGRVRMGLIIGAYVLYRVMRGVAESVPESMPFIMPFLILYIAFVVLSWLGAPFFNLLLRLNKYGRYALNRTQRIQSNAFGAMLLLTILCAVGWLVFRVEEWAFVALSAFLMSIVVVSALGMGANFKGRQGWHMFACALGVIAVGEVAAFAIGANSWGVAMFYAFVLGVFGFTIGVNFAGARRTQV